MSEDLDLIIDKGPSKFDLMVGLFEGKKIEFLVLPKDEKYQRILAGIILSVTKKTNYSIGEWFITFKADENDEIYDGVYSIVNFKGYFKYIANTKN